MKSFEAFFRLIVPIFILAVAIGGFVALGGPKPPPRKEKEPAQAAPVRTAMVETVSDGIEIEVDGVVVPLREVTLAAEVPGRVLLKTEACNEGQVVKKGDILFRIDPRDFELDLSRLEKELSQAGLAIEEVEEEIAQNAGSIALANRQVELARREVSRLDGLKAGRIVTESEHDRAIRDELTASNALTTLEGQKRVLAKRRNRLIEAKSLASTLLEKATLDLSRTTIASPVDGIVVEDAVEQDSFVSKGSPLVTIEDTSATEVRTSLRMDDVARVWGGRKGLAEGNGFPEVPAKVVFMLGDRRFEWDGVLSRQEGRGLDEKTRTLPCRVRVPDPTAVRALDRYGATLASAPPDAPRSLLRGMFVQVWLHVDVTQPLVSVPQEAVRPTGDLFVMRDGRLRVMPVKPFHVVDDRIFYDMQESGIDLFNKLKEVSWPWPVIFMTGHGDLEMAVDLVKQGAFDFVTKPFAPMSLINKVQQALQASGDKVQIVKELQIHLQRLISLTRQEQQVLLAILSHKTNREIAEEMSNSTRTIETHRANILKKMGTASALELAQLHERFLLRGGTLPFPSA